MIGGRHARSAVADTHRRKRMQHPSVRWILLCCALTVCGLTTLFTVRGLQIQRLRHQLEASQEAIEQAWIDRENLEAQLALKDDLPTIEEAARRQLGWVLPGEQRVIFIDPADESPGEGE